MIKKLFAKILSKTRKTGARTDHPVSTHRINPKFVDAHAMRVVQTLQQAKHEAYIVGGAVRDLILDIRPKDFDVATDATPEEVKSLFRRAFIIGRRFRIVHVVFGRGKEHDMIEVTTFRSNISHNKATVVDGNEHTSRADLAKTHHAVAHSGRVLRDNIWGTLKEDAMRRDFTINALYYEPKTQMVVDFHDGLSDAKNRVLRIIGDPEQRYKEDPVRMIRAIRFEAKLTTLGFKLDRKTAEPLKKCQHLLHDIPQSRLMDEIFKLLQTGHAIASIAALKRYHFDQNTFPILDLIVARSNQALIHTVLTDTDRRVHDGLSVSPYFLLASVLWSDVEKCFNEQLGKMPAHPAMNAAISEVLASQSFDLAYNGRLASEMREIWSLQLRFDKRHGKSVYSLLNMPRFREALDFLEFRAKSGNVASELVAWWKEFSQSTDEAYREDMLRQLPRVQTSKKNKQKSIQRDVSAIEDSTADSVDTAPIDQQTPRKPRRSRHRKHSTKSGDSSSNIFPAPSSMPPSE